MFEYSPVPVPALKEWSQEFNPTSFIRNRNANNKIAALGPKL